MTRNIWRSGFVHCVNCKSDFTIRGVVPTQPGVLARAVRAFEDPADIIMQPPMDLELTPFGEDVDVAAKEAEVSDALISFINATTKTGQESTTTTGAAKKKKKESGPGLRG